MATARERLRPRHSYEEDGYSWAVEQAELLRARRFDLPDVENVAEEIEDLGKSFANELSSRYGTLLTHLLKWEFQPKRGRTTGRVRCAGSVAPSPSTCGTIRA
jgi:hypothetical protein